MIVGGRTHAQIDDDSADRAPAIATDLTGDLPCLGCGYNLKGLSIRAVCPECGTAVRATILARVDPMAEELRPIRWPRLVAHALIGWAWAAIAAAVCVWVVRLGDVAWMLTAGATVRINELNRAALLFISLSGLCALGLVRPVAGQRGWDVCKAVGAVLLYALRLVVHFYLHLGYDADVGIPYVGPEGIEPGRSWLRLAENLTIIMIILGLGPNVVSLAERSLVMRTGRVDTQPLTALVGSLALASVGDVLLLLFGGTNGTVGNLLDTFVMVIAVGSFLFTLGLVGAGVDTVRLRSVLLRPAPGISDVIGGERDAGS